jgi:hypothetical protein
VVRRLQRNLAGEDARQSSVPKEPPPDR